MFIYQSLMNNFILFLLCAAIAEPCAGAATRKNAPTIFKHASIESHAANAGKKYFRSPEHKAIWKPVTQKVYGWENDEWILNETYVTEYTSTGLVAVDDITDFEGAVLRQINEYNENGMLTSQLSRVSEDGENFENSERLERKYDERLTSVITENYQWMWTGTDWNQQGINYRRIITRNADGNITSCVIATLYMGEFDPSQRIDITYGDDGKASRIEESQLAYNENDQFVWETSTICKDIVWDRTDGQITTTENLFMGANRIASAVFVDGDGEETNITATYFPGSEKYELHLTIHSEDGDIEGTQVYTPAENGGYTMVSRTDYVAFGDILSSEIYTETESYDDYGNLMLYDVTFSDGGTYTETVEHTEGSVEYDSTNGYPLVYTQCNYDWDTEEMVNTIRVEFSDYTDVAAGITDIEADNTDAPVEYYNLQGMRVDNPAAGNVYIRRQGAKSTKILMR